MLDIVVQIKTDVDVGVGLGDLAKAIRSNSSMRFGVYHSLYEWYHPLYLRDKANNFSTNDFVTSKTMPELYELVSLPNLT